jgi:hypothetical protein
MIILHAIETQPILHALRAASVGGYLHAACEQDEGLALSCELRTVCCICVPGRDKCKSQKGVCAAQEVQLSPMAVNVMAAAVPLLLALSSYLMHPLATLIGAQPIAIRSLLRVVLRAQHAVLCRSYTRQKLWLVYQPFLIMLLLVKLAFGIRYKLRQT